MTLPVLLTGTGNETSAALASTGTSVAVPKPANLADGDLLIAYGMNRNQTAAATPPSGWTAAPPSGGGVASSGFSTFFWKYITTASGEPSTYTFTSAASASGRMVITMNRVTGAASTSPIDVVGVETDGPSGTLVMTMAGVTTTGADRLLLLGVTAHVSSGAATVWGFTSPDFTMATKAVTGPTSASTSSVTIGYAGQATAGASGSKTATPDGSVSADYGQVIAIKPAVLLTQVTATRSTTWNVARLNTSPVADAGPDQTVEPWDTVTLDSSASFDPDGTIASRLWTRVSGPTVTLSSTTATKPTFAAPPDMADQVLVMQVQVTDNLGATATDTVSITILRATDGWIGVGGVVKPVRIDWL